MDRSIKFNAWDKINELIVRVVSIEYDHSGDINGVLVFTDEFGNYWLYPDQFELFQYTGRSDNLRQELYEGDIIECEYHLGLPTTNDLDTLIWRGVIKYGYDCNFHVYRFTDINDMSKLSNGTYAVGFGGSAVKRFERIGNKRELGVDV